MKEIGSYFCEIEQKKTEDKFFLSGRTALDYIIRDIIFEKKVKSVILPSWCCYTMIEPFIRHKIFIRFYDVYFDEEKGICVDIPEPLEDEVFYYMTYFGSTILNKMDESFVRKNWKCVIVDDTHSWLGEKRYDKFNFVPDYIYISYRKWTGLNGIALARKINGKFSIFINKKIDEKYSLFIENANKLKKLYLNGDNINKEDFLRLYIKSEKMIENDYIDYGPSILAVERLFNIDKPKIKDRRLKNSLVLIKELSDIENIKVFSFNLEGGDVPLFIPILVNENNRDKLREFLIKNRIYCPIHWPLSIYHNNISKLAKKIYYQELSILCDQRYEIKDMERIISIIKEFYSI